MNKEVNRSTFATILWQRIPSFHQACTPSLRFNLRPFARIQLLCLNLSLYQEFLRIFEGYLIEHEGYDESYDYAYGNCDVKVYSW